MLPYSALGQPVGHARRQPTTCRRQRVTLTVLGVDRRKPRPHVCQPLLPLSNLPLQLLASSAARRPTLQLLPKGCALAPGLAQFAAYLHELHSWASRASLPEPP